MELAKKMSMDNARSKYVMGASPGNYAKGGMISKAKAREILHDGTVHGKPITEKQRRFFGAMATRKAAGGMIADMMNPTAALDMLNQPQAVKALVTGNTNQPMKMGGMMNYAMGGRLVDEDMNPNDEAGEYDNYKRRFATGGDMKLSDNSFLVDGNPAVTDGNFYPQLNAKLDHGEVVKDNFVFSNKLRDPQTNVTYAKLAQPVEKSTGKAEKFMKRFQNDAFSKNTVMQNNKFLDSLSNKQEMLATAMGLRQNEQPTAYQVGGQMQGDPQNPFVSNGAQPFIQTPVEAIDKSGEVNPWYVLALTGGLGAGALAGTGAAAGVGSIPFGNTVAGLSGAVSGLSAVKANNPLESNLGTGVAYGNTTSDKPAANTPTQKPTNSGAQKKTSPLATPNTWYQFRNQSGGK